MSEGEEKTYCDLQVRDQTDGKSDVNLEIEKVNNNNKMSAKMYNMQNVLM